MLCNIRLKKGIFLVLLCTKDIISIDEESANDQRAKEMGQTINLIG